MQRMNSNLVLAASQQPDIMNALARGTQAAGMANEVQDSNALRSFMQQNGASVMAGEQNALAQLAQVGPQGAQMAMQAQDRQREYQMQQERMQMARAAGARAAASAARSANAAELAAERDQIAKGLAMAYPAIQSGDVARVAEVFTANGLEPPGSLDDAMMTIAQFEGAVEVIDRFTGMQPQEPEPDWVNLNGQLVDRAAPGGPAAIPVRGMPEQTSEREARINRLIQDRGLDRATAVGIVDGALDMSPLGEVVDLATGLPTNSPQQNDPMSFGSTVPDANYSGAFGGRGFGAQIANTAADAIGAPLPAPKTQTAVTALENVGLRTKTMLQEAFPGRASVQLMNELERVTAQPNQIFRGEQRSVDTLQQTSSLIEGLLEQEQRKIDNPRGYTAQMRAEAQSNIDQLGPLLADYRSILQQIDSGNDVSQSDIDLMNELLGN